MKWWAPLPLMIAAYSTLATAQPTNPTGKWDTPFGEMNLHRDRDQVSGTYSHNGGRVAGRYAGDVLTGYWFQDRSERTCPHPINGTRNWGRVSLRFNGDRFDGSWSYCGDAPDRGGWTGTRIAAPAAPANAAKDEDPTALLLGALAKELPPELTDLLGLDEAADNVAAPPPAVTRDMALGVLDAEWRAGLRNGRPATLEGDLTCDGSNDYFVGWTDLDNPERKSYHIAVVYHDGARLTHHHAEFDLGGDNQFSLCVMDPNSYPDVTLTGQAITDADRAAFNLAASCPGVVRLDDGMCGAIYIGWSVSEKQFVLHRN